MGQATPSANGLPLMLSSQASYVIVSGFRAALDLDAHPLSNFIRPRCAERATGWSRVLIVHIGFFACFHAISLERGRFSKITTLFFMPSYIALKMLVSLISRLVACSPRTVVDRQTDKQTHRMTIYRNPRCAIIIRCVLKQSDVYNNNSL